MKWNFKFWSQVKPQAKHNIDPSLGLRNWIKLSSAEKKKMWLHFNHRDFFIFDKREKKYPNNFVNEVDLQAIVFSVYYLKEYYKKQDLVNNYLSKQTDESCYEDFQNIFFNEAEDAVLEMLSAYAKYLFNLRSDRELQRYQEDTDEVYSKKLFEWRLKPLEEFKIVFNDIFEHFELNYRLTKAGIIPYQPKVILEKVYTPVLGALCDSKFEKVNRDLEDAIAQFQKKDPSSYSTCITLCVAAIEEFLRVIILGVSEKVNSSVLSKLIDEAQRKKAVPVDFFSKQIFSNLESIFRRKRQEEGHAHSKDDYATEKNAKLMLNLTMVFIQHAIEGN